MVKIKKKYENVNTLSRQQYNVALGSLLVSGLLLNFFMCQISFGFSNSFAFIIGYLIATFAAIFIAHVSDNKIVLTLCYYVIVVPLGVVLSDVLNAYGMDSSIVRNAVLITALVSAIMFVAGCIWKEMFLGFGRILFVSLLSIIIVSLICMLFGIYPIWISYLSAGIFSIYIGYDISVAQSIPCTYKNAVLCAMNLYLDIVNLLMDILNIVGNNKD